MIYFITMVTHNYTLAFYLFILLALFAFGIGFLVTHPAIQFVEQTQNSLVFRIQPLFVWVIGMVVSGLGFLVLIIPLTLIPITILTCNRPVPPFSLTNSKDIPSLIGCELVAKDWREKIKSNTPILGLQGATLEIETKHKRKKNPPFRLVLLTDKGQVPFPWHFRDSDYEKWQNLTAKINTFIKNPQEASLLVQQDERSLGCASVKLASFLWLVSFLVLAAAPIITCTLAQESNSLTLKRQKYFGAKSLTFKLSLDDISEVLLERNNGGGEGITERVTLKLTSGELFPFTYSYDSLGGKQQLAILIRKFLKMSKTQK